MIHDWDLWPIYLDRARVEAESAEHWAAMNRRLAEFVKAMNAAMPTIEELGNRLADAMRHPAPPATRK